ncbi:unnamed protein product [Candidula unifasciata]|uniref:DNA-directed primase/polymerase protein n=1 Tax=Candidula unifasciata TaxID=100452 RepID=A0A8S3Z7V2_9EUPU|nr:unnamed protein product [Candidula unifasciata]
MDCCPPSFTPSQFYGKSRYQHALSTEKKGSFKRKTSEAFEIILGPTNCWRVFFRQTEAFSWAKKTAEDVMVFAFENTDRDPALATGQRRYLVTSLDVFWHYYSQMEPSQRHHYEIIPEGWPCRLYFDLEFLKKLNTGSDGERMVGVLIQYVCMWLEAVFNIDCDRSCVLDLDASTESKFSRHLIFHIPGAVFANCVAAGNFVRHIFGLLVKYIKLKSNEQCISPAVLCEHCCRQSLCQIHQGFSNCIKSQPSFVNNCDFSEMSDEEFMAAAQICDEFISQNRNVETARSNGSDTNHGVNFVAIRLKTNDTSSGAVKIRSNDNSKSPSIEIRMNDFSSMDLNNGTTGISSHNLQSGIKNNIIVEKKQNCLEGHNCPSPYPEIDGFVESLTRSHGCQGRVRHWMCFRSSDSLLYDISGCRWCGNVQREHRSNNIMYIVDLRHGVCYQKCYDPDCQAIGYRSEAVEIPSNLLPSSYFEAVWEGDDDEWEDYMGGGSNYDTKDNSDINKNSLGREP